MRTHHVTGVSFARGATVVLLALGLLNSLGVRDAKAFDPVAAAAMVQQGYQGVIKILDTAGVSRQKAAWWIKGGHHVWWGCLYEDGTIVFNNFRSYCGFRDVLPVISGYSCRCLAVVPDWFGTLEVAGTIRRAA